MEHKLAIVIPAYKDIFLGKTLESLSNQTCLDFTVYIGDDCSPYDLYPIVGEYLDLLNIVYYRFDENLGRNNLVAHWNRCLNLMQGEPFFCLFSDDDLMSPNCAEQFYKMLHEERNSIYDVYHFDLDIIDIKGNLIKECALYPPLLSSSDFFYLLYTYRIDARMPEFIFRAIPFFEKGGFVEFDMAYRSDNATVMLHAVNQGIYTITGAKVKWRDSGLNLSSKCDPQLARRKAIANVEFFNWIIVFYEQTLVSCPFSLKERFRLVCGEILSVPSLSRKEKYKIFRCMQIEGGRWMRMQYRLRFLRRLYRNLG